MNQREFEEHMRHLRYLAQLAPTKAMHDKLINEIRRQEERAKPFAQRLQEFNERVGDQE